VRFHSFGLAAVGAAALSKQRSLSGGEMLKSNPGNFFEDFRLGQVIRHATPRTLGAGDTALYTALTGSRFALYSADSFAESLGLPRAPIDPLLVFHTVFGKTVPDISLNAVANLGYAEGKFLGAVYPGDTLCAESDVIGLKPNKDGKTGVVYVRTRGINQTGQTVLSYCRWVMVNKRDEEAGIGEVDIPDLASVVAVPDLIRPTFASKGYDWVLAGSGHGFGDYEVGEKIDHVDAMTVEEAEHQIATRLYQNTARVHFDALGQQSSRFGKRLIYGGVVISIARALAFNGLANAAAIIAINGGRHVAPLFAGDTVFAWSEVLDKADLGAGWGALRLRLTATKNRPCSDHPLKTESGDYTKGVILDFDYWAAIPQR
jgi:2-methylfumaryl-CoA hydratase